MITLQFLFYVLQNLISALRIITGCMKSTPTNASEVIMGILPIDLRCQQIVEEFITNCSNNSSIESLQMIKDIAPNSKLAIILSTNDSQADSFNCFQFDYEDAFFEPTINLSYFKNLSNGKQIIANHKHNQIFKTVTAGYDKKISYILTARKLIIILAILSTINIA